MEKYIIGKALREAGFRHPAPITLTPPVVEVGEKKKVMKWSGKVDFYKENPPVKTTVDLEVTYRLNGENDIDLLKVTATNER